MSSSISSAVSSTISAATSSITNPNVLTGSRVLIFTTTIPATATAVTVSVTPVLDMDTPAQRAKINNTMDVVIGVILGIYLILGLLVVGMWLRGRYQERQEKHRYKALAQSSADEALKATRPEVTLTPHTPVIPNTSNRAVDVEALIGGPSQSRGTSPVRQQDLETGAAGGREPQGSGHHNSRFGEDTGYQYAGWRG